MILALATLLTFGASQLALAQWYNPDAGGAGEGTESGIRRRRRTRTAGRARIPAVRERATNNRGRKIKGPVAPAIGPFSFSSPV
jgi:hypothetical protein